MVVLFVIHMEAMENSAMQHYCQISNYCYACFLVDPQDPETLRNGLCYHCHGIMWDKMKHSFTSETLRQTILRLNSDSKWYSFYNTEYKARNESN